MSRHVVTTLEAPLGATAERQAVLATSGEAPGKDWVIVTRGIKREYDMGGDPDHVMWWALALGADLGGNATAIGASANVVVLGIAERTVKAHLTSVFTQIGVTDRTSAALWAHRRGLVGAPPKPPPGR